jgi:ribonuclease BN (tRNA processing enzyme)
MSRDLRVRFLGSGDAFGSGGRFQTCILLRSSACCVLLDCGASSLIAMQRAGLESSEVDAILLSHLHGDHFGGVPFFLLDARFARRTRPLPIAGPPGLEARIREAQEVLFPDSSRVEYPFETLFVDLEEGRRSTVGPVEVTAHAAAHPSGAPSYALRVEAEGKTVTYSGDTEWTGQLVAAAAGADLFICECSFYDRPVRFHLDYRTLIAHRPELACERIILTHMSPEMLAKAGEVELECARDGLEIRL